MFSLIVLLLYCTFTIGNAENGCDPVGTRDSAILSHIPRYMRLKCMCRDKFAGETCNQIVSCISGRKKTIQCEDAANFGVSQRILSRCKPGISTIDYCDCFEGYEGDLCDAPLLPVKFVLHMDPPQVFEKKRTPVEPLFDFRDIFMLLPIIIILVSCITYGLTLARVFGFMKRERQNHDWNISWLRLPTSDSKSQDCPEDPPVYNFVPPKNRKLSEDGLDSTSLPSYEEALESNLKSNTCSDSQADSCPITGNSQSNGRNFLFVHV